MERSRKGSPSSALAWRKDTRELRYVHMAGQKLEIVERETGQVIKLDFDNVRL